MKVFTLKWDDLTDKEKEMAREQYIHIKEWEERRKRNKTNQDYSPILSIKAVEECTFERIENNQIWVNIW